MTFSLTAILPLPDMLALGWFFLCWVGYAWYADHRRWGTRELASVLHEYRLRWMRRVLERENRIADTVVLQTVMRSDIRCSGSPASRLWPPSAPSSFQSRTSDSCASTSNSPSSRS